VLPPPRRRRLAAARSARSRHARRYELSAKLRTTFVPHVYQVTAFASWDMERQNYSNFRSVVNGNQLKVIFQTDSAGRRVHPLWASTAALVLLLWHVS
jgi:hypothetical protein